MRIVGSIDHPVLKITIFRNDNRLSVKFESGLYEQTYKFRDGEGVASVEDAYLVVDEDLISKVAAMMQPMHEARIAALSRQQQHSGVEEEEFEEII